MGLASCEIFHVGSLAMWFFLPREQQSHLLRGIAYCHRYAQRP